MKQRIINKKLKEDVLVHLWIKQWRHSLNNLTNIMSLINKENYEDHNSIWYCQYKLNTWLMVNEFNQVLNIGRINHNIKAKQVYDYLLRNKMVAFEYKYYKKLFKE